MIGIICLGDIRYSPYIEKYTSVLEKNNTEYEFVFWDRYPEKNIKHGNENLNIFTCSLQDNAGLTKKVLSFYKFRKFVLDILKEKQYDKLIILTTLTGVLLFDILNKKYKKKFLYDYRDASFEYLPGFNFILKILFNNSYGNFISSNGFRSILPEKCSYTITHNFRNEDLQYENEKMEIKKQFKSPITVSFIGNLRESGYVKLLIDTFGSDSRFQLQINGGGENLEELRRYSSKFTNVNCTGAYENKDKKDFINNADILCYNYPSSFINDYAIANKYYDSLIFKKPLLGNIETYSGRMIEDRKLGVSLKIEDEDYTDKLYNYFLSFNPEQFSANAKVELEKVLIEDQEYLKEIEKFIFS